MPKGVYDRTPKEIPVMASTETAATPQPSKLFPVKLLKNYRPAGAYELVGYHQPEITQKDSAGKVTVVKFRFSQISKSAPTLRSAGKVTAVRKELESNEKKFPTLFSVGKVTVVSLRLTKT